MINNKTIMTIHVDAIKHRITFLASIDGQEIILTLKINDYIQIYNVIVYACTFCPERNKYNEPHQLYFHVVTGDTDPVIGFWTKSESYNHAQQKVRTKKINSLLLLKEERKKELLKQESDSLEKLNSASELNHHINTLNQMTDAMDNYMKSSNASQLTAINDLIKKYSTELSNIDILHHEEFEKSMRIFSNAIDILKPLDATYATSIITQLNQNCLPNYYGSYSCSAEHNFKAVDMGIQVLKQIIDELSAKIEKNKSITNEITKIPNILKAENDLMEVCVKKIKEQIAVSEHYILLRDQINAKFTEEHTIYKENYKIKASKIEILRDESKALLEHNQQDIKNNFALQMQNIENDFATRISAFE